MIELLPLGAPALVVVTVAAVLVRSERGATVAIETELGEVPTVPVGGDDWCPGRSPARACVDGALVEPVGRTLGGRIRESDDVVGAAPSQRIRVRRQQLVASGR